MRFCFFPSLLSLVLVRDLCTFCYFGNVCFDFWFPVCSLFCSLYVQSRAFHVFLPSSDFSCIQHEYIIVFSRLDPPGITSDDIRRTTDESNVNTRAQRFRLSVPLMTTYGNYSVIGRDLTLVPKEHRGRVYPRVMLR